MKRIFITALVVLLAAAGLSITDASARHTQGKKVVVTTISKSDGLAACSGRTKCSGCGSYGCLTIVCHQNDCTQVVVTIRKPGANGLLASAVGSNNKAILLERRNVVKPASQLSQAPLTSTSSTTIKRR